MRRPVSDDIGRRSVSMRRAACFAVLVASVTLGAAAQDSGAPAGARQQDAGPRPFRPGIQLDWARRAVHVMAEVVQDRGPLEFVACWPGKEHESLVRMNCSAGDLFMALGLLGFEAGRPPRWDAAGAYTAPTGDLVDVTVRWNAADGPRTDSMFGWVRNRTDGSAVVPLPWVYAGSVRGPGPVLRSDDSGSGFAVVDQPDSFLQLDLRQSSQDSLLWLAANPEAVPPRGAPVTLILRPATVPAYEATLDARGDLMLNGVRITAAELAIRIDLARRLDASYELSITNQAVLKSDVLRLRAALERAALPAGSWRIR